ncbi:hypothetical protein DTL42_18630 [Bremerella cremea]|uniref:Uncharacterized protein n=1 Tax=Bremerella cremea TaxID=1031537 RepID=A0A368KMX0_9BACT|nr:hypothetical protein [Bremerella cremea]RCS44000.1 hypothetical protein DTL42_18630 [Bremerella cremea]
MKVLLERTLDAIEHAGVLFDCRLLYTILVRSGIPGYRYDSEVIARKVVDFQLEDPHGMHFSSASSPEICAWAEMRIFHALDELDLAREAAEKPPLIDRDLLCHEAIAQYEIRQAEQGTHAVFAAEAATPLPF